MKPDWRGYPLRPFSFVSSTAFHAGLIILLASVHFDQQMIEKNIYVEVPASRPRKIIYQDFRKPLPDVADAQSKSVGELQGTTESTRIVRAASPRPVSNAQSIWLPAAPPLPKDVPLPDLISRIGDKLPAVTPQPPPAAPTEKAAGQENAPVKKIAQFVPPTPAKAPQLEMQMHALEGVTPPDARTTPDAAGLSGALSSIPSARPSAPNPQGQGSVDVAVVNKQPKEAAIRALPDGSRAGSFEVASSKGTSTTGAVGGRGLTIPDLAVRNQAIEKRAATKTVLYSERVRTTLTSSLSVPLRPSSRMIPSKIDARFQGRNVYTMVIPIENFPEYEGDWIIWFAERTANGGATTPVMRAPTPWRKGVLVESGYAAATRSVRVLLSGTIGKDGKIEDLALLTSLGSTVQVAVMRDIAAWEFQPATRNGVPVEVDIVAEISILPYLATASNTLP
jgi:hypothetical protein